MISIYSSKQQPYGLLSNNARLPITVDGSSYVTVTDYVYGNLFLKDEFIERFKRFGLDGVYANPYAHFMRLYVDMQIKMFERYIVNGSRLRIDANETLKRELNKLTTDAIVTFDDQSVALRSLSDSLNLYPETTDDYFFDLIRGKVPRKQIIGIINGIVAALSAGKTVHFTTNYDVIKATYEDDKKTSSQLSREFYDAVFEQLGNKVYMIIAAVKRVFSADLSLNVAFCDKLLDIYLRKIIREQYPRIEDEMIPKAIAQQMKRQSPQMLSNIKTRLISMYNNTKMAGGGSKSGDVFSHVRNPNDELKLESDRLLFMDKRDAFIKVVKPIRKLSLLKSQFLPHNSDYAFTAPNGVTYPSVLHYTYANIYREIFSTIDIVDLSQSPLQVQESFKSYESTMIHDTIKANFKRAFDVKLQTYPSVRDLIRHASRKLKWDDENDPVLNVFYTETIDALIASSSHEEEEEEERRLARTNITRTIYEYAVFRQWLYLKSEEYFNVANMFNNVPTTRDLATIYFFIQPRYEQMSDEEITDVSLISLAGVDAELRRSIMPLLVGEFIDTYLDKSNLSQAVKAYVDNYSSDTYCINKTDYTKAVKNLSDIYDSLRDKLASSKDKEAFVRVILSGTLDSDSYLPQRVRLWSLDR